MGDIQWCFSQVKGSTEDFATEGQWYSFEQSWVSASTLSLRFVVLVALIVDFEPANVGFT